MRSARLEVGLQAPPAPGYSVEIFEGYLEEIRARIDHLKESRPHEAVFEITYLTFSKQVLAALKAGRFEDSAWATDMACRFIEVYQQQARAWRRRDPRLCRAWRVAFEAMEEGRINVLQAMLLGINAHINYDLAFVSLGACLHAGDLAAEEGADAAERSLAASRSAVPAVRYRDFLVINQLEWEAIEEIQDVVLEDYSRLLYWGNRLTGRFTRFAGQQLLMEMRDDAWYQTTLLIHAREGEERALVARLIDARSAALADLIGSLSHRPGQLLGNAVGWMRRGERIDPELQAGLVELAGGNPVVAELALRELAFGGADPVAILQSLLQRGESRLAGLFGRQCLERSPLRQKGRLSRFLAAGSDSALAAAEALLAAGADFDTLPGATGRRLLRDRWRESLEGSFACLSLPEVAASPGLRAALGEHIQDRRARLAAGQQGRPVPVAGRPLRLEEARRFLADHPDPWVRANALALPDLCPEEERETGAAMASKIERVLFLKESELFMEVDVSVLMHVAENLERKRFDDGASLLKAGQKSGGLHVVTSGRLEVRQDRDGERIVITSLGEHDVVGELSVLDDTPATADCVALGPVETYFLSATVLSNLMHQHPRLSIGMMRMLSRRLADTTRRVQSATATG